MIMKCTLYKDLITLSDTNAQCFACDCARAPLKHFGHCMAARALWSALHKGSA